MLIESFKPGSLAALGYGYEWLRALDGERPPLQRLPPTVGQHNAELLAELGFSGEEIQRLTASAAMRTA